MKIELIIICCMCVFISCDNKDEAIHNSIDKIELTQEEYISIAYDNPKEISTSKALELVNSFSNLPKSRSYAVSTRVKRKFYIAANDKNEILTASTRSTSKGSVPIYEIELKNDTAVGYSLVSADERYPAVLAYIPRSGAHKYSQNIGAKLMTELAEGIALSTITQYEVMKDSLRERTLAKIARSLNKDAGDVSFDKIKDLIQIEKKETTRSQVDFSPSQGVYQSGLTPRIAVNWSQSAPYNRKLKQECSYDEDKEGRYSAGCVVVCLAQVLSYFEPNMFVDGITINWKLLKSSPTISVSSSSDKINQVSTLMKFIGNRTNTKYLCGEGGSTSTESAVKNFLPLYNIIADSRSGWNTSKVKLSLGTSEATFKPVIVTGVCDDGGHAWALDGYQIRKDLSKGNELYYVHANMGWGSVDDGYFLVENAMTFECYYNSYFFNRSISIYPNVRKK